MSISLALATRGIPSDSEYGSADDYEFDPWRPLPGEEVVLITIPLRCEKELADLVRWRSDEEEPGAE